MMQNLPLFSKHFSKLVETLRLELSSPLSKKKRTFQVMRNLLVVSIPKTLTIRKI